MNTIPKGMRGPSGQGARSSSFSAFIRTGALGAAALLAFSGCGPTKPAPIGLTAAPATAVVYNPTAAFSVGVVPNRAPPVRIGEELGFKLSASAAGYGHLYLINASGAVLVLVENLAVTSGTQAQFPGPSGGFTFRAIPPAGVERVLFLVTRQPFQGFGGSASGPVQLAVRAQEFLRNLNEATASLSGGDWALTETRVEIVTANG